MTFVDACSLFDLLSWAETESGRKCCKTRSEQTISVSAAGISPPFYLILLRAPKTGYWDSVSWLYETLKALYLSLFVYFPT